MVTVVLSRFVHATQINLNNFSYDPTGETKIAPMCKFISKLYKIIDFWRLIPPLAVLVVLFTKKVNVLATHSIFISTQK